MQTLNFQQPLAGMIVAGLIDVDTVRPEIKAGRYIVRSTNCFNQDELPDFSKQELLNKLLVREHQARAHAARCCTRSH